MRDGLGSIRSGSERLSELSQGSGAGVDGGQTKATSASWKVSDAAA